MNAVPVSLRRERTELEYAKAQLHGLGSLGDAPTLREYRYWRVIDNLFPYDMAFHTHHLLLPKRIVPSRRLLNYRERLELESIFDELEDKYDILLENFPHMRSIPGHYHLHLAVFHNRREDMF